MKTHICTCVFLEIAINSKQIGVLRVAKSRRTMIILRTMKGAGAEKFWERFDRERKAKGFSIKSITERLDLSYPLLITQRSRQIYPSVTTACKIAKTLGTTVEYLTTGEELVNMAEESKGTQGANQKLIPLDVVLAMSHSSEEDMRLVRRIYRLPAED